MWKQLIAQLQHRGRRLRERLQERRARRRYLRREKHRRRAERVARSYAVAAAAVQSARVVGSLFVEGSRSFSQYIVPYVPEDVMMINQQLLQAKYAENQRARGVLADGSGGGGVSDPELDQFLEDERIALFLQNEEFMAELRWNKDFLTALEKEHGSESPPDELPYRTDEDMFRERIWNMGKLSRKKFAMLARMFTGRKKRSAKQILGHAPCAAPGNTKDSLLLNSEPLLSLSADDEDDEDDEGHAHVASGSSSAGAGAGAGAGVSAAGGGVGRDRSRSRSRDRV